MPLLPRPLKYATERRFVQNTIKNAEHVFLVSSILRVKRSFCR